MCCSTYFFFLSRTIENESRVSVSPRFSSARIKQIRGIIKSHDSTGRPRLRIVYLARCHGQIIQSRRTQRLLMSVAISPAPSFHSLIPRDSSIRSVTAVLPEFKHVFDRMYLSGIQSFSTALFNTLLPSDSSSSGDLTRSSVNQECAPR